ncbi:hypothetical protein [Streptomyces melanogenes]|uniref:hypothetical protein n=1 Tax=Streptomyces melanogenes TaxID=67326 RepID=UPI00167C5A79|nr:hypothetical protein [Streptomyces melanogenes]GGP86943.1 hypothetical protein GCM10010278_76990 [Streptomyces melanogenes]
MPSPCNRPRVRQACAAALTAILAVTVLVGCGNDNTKVTSLPKNDGKQTGSGDDAPAEDEGHVRHA